LQKLRGTRGSAFSLQIKHLYVGQFQYEKWLICIGNYCYNKLIYSPLNYWKKAVKTSPLLFPWCICSIVYITPLKKRTYGLYYGLENGVLSPAMPLWRSPMLTRSIKNNEECHFSRLHFRHFGPRSFGCCILADPLIWHADFHPAEAQSPLLSTYGATNSECMVHARNKWMISPVGLYAFLATRMLRINRSTIWFHL